MTNKINMDKLTEFLNPVNGPNFAPADKKGKPTASEAAKDSFKKEGKPPFKKFGYEATKRKTVSALFRQRVDPKISQKPMKELAKHFIDNPSFVNTEKGGVLLRELMSNVEGFDDLV